MKQRNVAALELLCAEGMMSDHGERRQQRVAVGIDFCY
jgi:hypothetical protein